MADEAVSDAAISSAEVAATGGDKPVVTEQEKGTTKSRLNFSEECGGSGEEEGEEGGGEGSDSDSPGDGEEEEELLFPGFVAKSLRWLPQTNKLRFVCLKIITWTYPFTFINLV